MDASMMARLGRLDPSRHDNAWAVVLDRCRPAPGLMMGPLPRRSPDLARFRNPRRRNQVIGSCVGQSGAAMAETTIRTPSPFDEASQPNPAIDLSPLWVYAVARKYSRDHGVPISGEGAIVSHALLAVQELGFVKWEAWPGTSENEQSFRDGVIPQAARDAVKLMPIQDVRRLTDPDQILEYLAGGYSVWVGMPWRGGTSTRSDGYFEWRGRSVGGHAVELLGYDLDADRVVVGNSWGDWGVNPGCIGWTRWSAMSRDLTGTALDRGESEACVISEVDGWAPKVRSWLEVL